MGVAYPNNESGIEQLERRIFVAAVQGGNSRFAGVDASGILFEAFCTA